MENAVDALKIAFAMMMFVMALSLSMFSLSKANSAVTAIISLNDREIEYNYVDPNPTNTRTVGVETIVPTMYKAYKENFQIYFLDKNNKPLIIYYAIDSGGNRKKDESGHDIGINCIDGSEVFGSAKEAEDHLNRILGNPNTVDIKYKKQLNLISYPNGLYKYLIGKKFTEQIGEYYQNDSENTPEVNKTKTRVVTYTLID